MRLQILRCRIGGFLVESNRRDFHNQARFRLIRCFRYANTAGATLQGDSERILVGSQATQP